MSGSSEKIARPSVTELTDEELDAVAGGIITPGADPNLPPQARAPAVAGPGPICFVRGTRIETVGGPVAIEALKIGDLVRTQSGGHKPILWIGRRSYEKAPDASWPDDVWPVCIAPSAIGPGIPARHVSVSQFHALLLGGALIRAKDVVNGLTIAFYVPEGLNHLDYFHLEFEQHEIIYADGAAVESMKPSWEERERFANFAEFERLYGRVDTAATPCVPLASEGAVAAQRAMLAARAELLRADMTETVA